MPIATFGAKTFEVSQKNIYTPDEIAFSQSLNKETQDVEGKKPATYIKGINLMPLSFTVKLDARFLDVKKEIDFWNNKVISKVPEVFTIGGKIISPYKFLLLSSSVTDLVTGKKGIFLKAKVSLQFEEYVSEGYKKDTATSSSSTSKKKKSAKSTKSAVHKMSPEAIKAIEEASKK